jgi:GTP pyrophosphokinase
MCDKAFRKHGLSFNNYVKSGEMAEAAADFGYKSVDDLLAGIGYGKATPLQVVRRFVPHMQSTEETEEGIVSKIKERIRRPKPQSGILVKGVEDVLVRYAKCCKPLPGDPVVGYITRGQGITVHRTTCTHALNMDSARRIELSWAAERNELYPVGIHVRCHDKMGLLANITAALSAAETNILDANVKTAVDGKAECYFTISVSDANHLERALKSIKSLKNVITAKRLEGSFQHG